MTARSFNEGGVPLELKDRDQWLLWSSESNPPKRPLNADGRGASWNDPSEWLSFDEALDAARESDCDGVGFVLSEGDPYVGIDLDGCLREAWAPKPASWLPGLDTFKGTYIEYSVSGTGLHVFVKAEGLPAWWSDSHFTEEEHEGVEAYSSKFLIVTGRPLEAISGPTIQEVDVSQFLGEAYQKINGEQPSMPGADDQPEYDGDGPDIGIYDVISRSDHPEDTNVPHPFHPSSTGTNFMVDRGGKTFRCWRHDVTGNALHLFGIKQGVISCGDWDGAGLSSDQWREIFDALRAAGYDAPMPGSQTAQEAATDGGAAAFQTAAEHRQPDVELTPLEVLSRAGYDPDETALGDIKASEAAFAIDRILTEHQDWHFLVVDDDSEDIYSYDTDVGVWRRDGERKLKAVCRQAMGSANSRQAYRELVYYAQGNPELLIGREALGAPDATVATPNGLLDLRRRETEPLEPTHRALNRIATAYNPGTDYESTRWMEFLEESVRPEDLDKLQEYAGYTLWHHAQPFGKALFLVGPTNSGKGTFLKAISQVIGDDNIANESLWDLQSRWGPARLFGNMINVRNEVTPGGISKIEKFKEMTGGGDAISAEYKGKDKFEFRVTQKFLFATNQMPNVEEADEAFYGRLLFALFPHTVPDEEQDKGLLDAFDDEREAILNWMLDGLDRLMELGRFSNERTREQKEAIMTEYGNVVDRFVSNVLEITGDADDVVHKGDLYAVFTRFNDYIGREPSVQQVLTRELKTLDGVGDGRSRRVSETGDREHVYTGIRVDEKAIAELQADHPQHATSDDDRESDPSSGQQSLS